MAPRTIRKALGQVKDQTSIGLAKVSGNIAPDLDVAIVKATSHDDNPADEKYLREILNLTSYSREYVNACVTTVSKRLGKTRDWIVALKALMLVHRLMAEGDPAFQHEILYATRKGTRLLNMSDFCDEAHSHSLDHSAFVRTYALYLDQRLELMVYEQKQDGGDNADSNGGHRTYKSPRRSGFGNADPYAGGSYGRSSYSSPPAVGSNAEIVRYDDRYKSPNRGSEEKKPPTPLRDMKPERILGKIYQLQALLDRLLALRPTGTVKNSRMILIALYPIVRESFQLYAEVSAILAVLLDRYFDMEYPDCVKSFEVYASAAKQIGELAAFYAWCKDTGVARLSEYPEVQGITGKLLDTLEGFMRNRPRRPADPPKMVDAAPEPATHETEQEPSQDTNSTKALPAPSEYGEKPPKREEPQSQQQQPQPQPQPQPQADLVNLKDDVLAVDHENKLALALFSAGGTTAASNGSWEAFSSGDGGDNQVTSAWQTPAAEKGKADWELALVETASNLSKQKADLAGGFDSLLLNGMYDQGAIRQHVNGQISGGSASSVALPGLGQRTAPVLALPAPDGTVQTVGGDPFAASSAIPAPSYVQMADMEKKQQLLVQEQHMWHYHAQNGTQGQSGFVKLDNSYTYSNTHMPYEMPPHNPTTTGYFYPS